MLAHIVLCQAGRAKVLVVRHAMVVLAEEMACQMRAMQSRQVCVCACVCVRACRCCLRRVLRVWKGAAW